MPDATVLTSAPAPQAAPAAGGNQAPAATATVPTGQATSQDAAPKQDAASAANPGQKQDAPPAKADNAASVPEKYELKLADGSPLDPAVVAQTAELAKAKGLTQEQAAAVLAHGESLVSKHLEAVNATWQKQVNETWIAQVQADPEIGGQQFAASTESARQALAKFGSPALREALEQTGLGNHPELIRVFSKIGRAMAEDSIGGARKAPAAEKSTASLLYGGGK